MKILKTQIKFTFQKFTELTSKNILTMEYIKGRRIDKLKGNDINKLNCIRAIFSSNI